ncbi:MAG: helix-turn-helix transcriptional regulator [Bdellovibrionota bacterium]
MKRSSKKIITQKARVLRYVRVSRGISQRAAGRRCGISDAAVGHYENGRMDISEERLAEFLRAYECSREEFDRYLAGAEVPIVSVKDDCMNLLQKLDDSKLRTIHSVLMAFLGQ